jgi:hypothetical protein
MYSLARVGAAEALPEFQAELVKLQIERLAKRATKSDRITARQHNLKRRIADKPYLVKLLELGDLQKQAIHHYNNEIGSSDFSIAHADSDPAFLERIMVNFVRHQLTDYERKIESAQAEATRADQELASNEVRRLTYTAIAQAYPALSKECIRQLEERRFT